MNRTGKYSESPRAIGRDLEAQDIQLSVLTKRKNEYLVQTRDSKGLLMVGIPSKTSRSLTGLGLSYGRNRSEALRTETVAPSSPAGLWEIRYTSGDIERLGRPALS